MRLCITIAALLILLAGLASAATVTTESGDQITGDLLRTEGRLLVVKNPHMGLVRVPISSIRTIETDRAFTIVLGSGDRVTGVIETDGKGNLEIENETGSVSTPLAEVHGMMPAPMSMAYPDAEEPGTDEMDAAIADAAPAEWDGLLELGFNWQTGNTERLGLTFGLTLTRETDSTRSEVRASVIYTEDDDVRTANRQLLAFQHDIKLSEKWYFFGLLALSRDEFKDIDFRGALTPGIGYIFADTDAWKLRTEVGPTATYTSWSEMDNEWTLEIYLAAKAEVQVFDKARLIQNLYWYPSITNAPDGRLVSETAFEQPLSETLFLKISFIVNYDTSVDSPTKETDTDLLVTLAIKF